ncbi:hypothetical protein Desor_3750 [Desulfosporosinus orientis DSM 765]|uniref:Methyltransferase domain-containing protein n=1 Tax=Desulfosporosinus orientis (strain ATCC 19365 / DSM 765 / NCIMB 8382 / VKM B-1628 / Singapore I) TaxID=768706 RepID=G7W6T1_DESOD|nr:class I SAM-dependent methyltransferase [Desulfosporosinus orientis]AET69213.1 hypothetical protein Desor_3750 [Desulfosporosinus orientis DSM 765]
MYKTKTLFVGCGDGRELLSFANDQDHLLIGLEPIDQLYALAKARIIGKNTGDFPHIQLHHCRIQDFQAAEYAGKMDQIYFIFPTPEVLRREARVIADRVYSLLAEETGMFRIYTEVTLSEWPDLEDRARLACFLQTLQNENFSFSAKEIGYHELPPMARESNCGLKFQAHGITRFTAIEAIKETPSMGRQPYGKADS